MGNLLKIAPNRIYSEQSTKGVLEMGGESLQITFIPHQSALNSLNGHKHAHDSDVHHIETINIGDVQFELFTYSWMGVGMEAAQNKFDSYLATKQKERNNSPCYIKGDTRERQHGIGQAVTWKGSGNFKECYDGLSEMINERLKSKCSIPSIDIEQLLCTPNSVLMPKIAGNKNEFYYIENFYYTAKVLNLLDVHGQEFLDKLNEKGEEYCSLDIDKAKIKYPEASEEEIQKTCFCAAWLLAILNNGYNLEKFSQFKVIRDIEGEKGGNIDWALGYLVAEVPNMNMNEDEILGTYTVRFLLIMMVISIMIYCWYKGIKNTQSNLINQSTKSWLYSKIGIGQNIKKETSNNKNYAYQRLN